MRSWLVVIGLCLAVAGGLGYYKYQQIQAAIAFGAAYPEPVESTDAFIAREEIWQPVTSVSAEVVAVRSVTLSNELAGTIVEVGFAPGAQVAQGQVLVRLDISEERAQLAAARADAEIARLELSRNQKLIKSGAAAQETRDQAKARYDAAIAAVNRLRAVIEKKTLRSPFEAMTGLHQLEVGQYLDKATQIARLIGIDDEVWIDFTLPQQEAQLSVGESITVVMNIRQQSFPASIIARDAFVNEVSRNVRYRALADNTELAVYAGSLVTVEVPLGEPRVITLVPTVAVRRDAFSANVFVLVPAEEGARAAERAQKRQVQLGPQRGELVVITDGLKPGERVAANGAFKLREGVLVNAQAMEPTAFTSTLIDSGAAQD